MNSDISFFSALVPFGEQWFGFLKIGVLVILLIYIFFSLMVIKQIGIMNRVLQTKLAPILTLLGFIHLLVVVLIFILALVSL